ncbi:MAG: antibiotic biosynthesis monooxygenase [Rubrobacter sp.]|nr:antibiotic biosynthesis monooxygenase [Rubrobacter sp.]
MYVAIRRYQVDPGSVDEVTRQVLEGFIPIIKDAPGFLEYYALDAGDGVIAAVSVFEDQSGAEESSRMAADWVRQNLSSLIPNPPEITAGRVGAHELNLTKLATRKVTE